MQDSARRQRVAYSTPHPVFTSSQIRHTFNMSISPESKPPPLEVELMPQQVGVPNGLDWTGVTNPAQRRKLQNRLNQAASSR